MRNRDSFVISDDGGDLRMYGQNTVWEEVLHLGTRMLLQKDALMRGGNYDQFYYVKRGCIRLERLGRSGDDCIMLYLMDGTFFNEAVCIIQPMTRRDQCDISFTAIEDTELYAFKSDMLASQDFITRYPHLVHNLLKSVAYKSRFFMYNGSSSKLHSHTARVCCMLYRMYADSDYGVEIAPRISQTELGKALGIPRSTLCRILAHLREEGIIGSFTKKKLEILDADKLMNLTST